MPPPSPAAEAVGPGVASVVVTLLFWAAFALTAPVGFLIGCLVFAVTFPFDPSRRVLHAFICRWCVGYLRLNPLWRLEVRGRERLPSGPAVLVANHQSMVDIVAAMALFHPFKFVSKASLFGLPLLGWMMSLLRHVRLERGRPRSTLGMLEACRTWLRLGTAVLLFPEGTYAPPGERLPFRKGAFLLAVEEQVPIVPVVLEGTRELVVEDGPWLAPRAHLRVTVLAPLQPGRNADADALAESVRALFVPGASDAVFPSVGPSSRGQRPVSRRISRCASTCCASICTHFLKCLRASAFWPESLWTWPMK